jgi:hypothetical protein
MMIGALGIRIEAQGGGPQGNPVSVKEFAMSRRASAGLAALARAGMERGVPAAGRIAGRRDRIFDVLDIPLDLALKSQAPLSDAEAEKDTTCRKIGLRDISSALASPLVCETGGQPMERAAGERR